MLEKILKSEKEKITKEVKGKIMGARYLIKQIRKRQHEFREVFIGQNGQSLTLEEEERKIYEGFKEMIENLEQSYLNTESKKLYRIDRGKDFPEVRLGLAEIGGLGDEQKFGYLKPTKRGKEMISNYRIIRGYPSLRKQKKNN